MGEYRLPSRMLTDWLISSPEPWTRYRTQLDLLNYPPDSIEVQSARQEMLHHPWIQSMVSAAKTWQETIIKRHNDSSHPLFKISTLADFGLKMEDEGIPGIIDAVLAHRSVEGAFQSLTMIPAAFGGNNQAAWTWMACDAPTLLYALQTFGLTSDVRLQPALNHMVGLVENNGWHCSVAPELGKFHGPGRRTDPCPIANVLVLKALSTSQFQSHPVVQNGIDALLQLWENRTSQKPYLFGMGSDFCKLKYPYIWYDILHVVEVLSCFPTTHHDVRFLQMVEIIKAQANPDGTYTAGSMYQSWKGWSFADKKEPSPWLTFLVYRILKRLEQDSSAVVT
jgi:hypothetical protein